MTAEPCLRPAPTLRTSGSQNQGRFASRPHSAPTGTRATYRPSKPPGSATVPRGNNRTMNRLREDQSVVPVLIGLRTRPSHFDLTPTYFRRRDVAILTLLRRHPRPESVIWVGLRLPHRSLARVHLKTRLAEIADPSIMSAGNPANSRTGACDNRMLAPRRLPLSWVTPFQ
jgi:hypothetical protein